MGRGMRGGGRGEGERRGSGVAKEGGSIVYKLQKCHCISKQSLMYLYI